MNVVVLKIAKTYLSSETEGNIEFKDTKSKVN